MKVRLDTIEVPPEAALAVPGEGRAHERVKAALEKVLHAAVAAMAKEGSEARARERLEELKAERARLDAAREEAAAEIAELEGSGE